MICPRCRTDQPGDDAPCASCGYAPGIVIASAGETAERQPGDATARRELGGLFDIALRHRCGAASLLAALEHVHVVPVYSAGATEHCFWYTTEYVEGPSLVDTLRDGSMDLA